MNCRSFLYSPERIISLNLFLIIKVCVWVNDLSQEYFIWSNSQHFRLKHFIETIYSEKQKSWHLFSTLWIPNRIMKCIWCENFTQLKFVLKEFRIGFNSQNLLFLEYQREISKYGKPFFGLIPSKDISNRLLKGL